MQQRGRSLVLSESCSGPQELFFATRQSYYPNDFLYISILSDLARLWYFIPFQTSAEAKLGLHFETPSSFEREQKLAIRRYLRTKLHVIYYYYFA